MGKLGLGFWLSALVLAGPPLALADTAYATLSPQTQTVPYGHTPRFYVTVTAGSAPLRIMRLSARRDLRDNYAKIHVTRADSKPVIVNIAISDPGPLGPSDYVVLAPGHAETVEHDGEPYDLGRLEPGDYFATVDVRPDLDAPVLRTNTVAFRVIRP